jgi:hypothetical protein
MCARAAAHPSPSAGLGGATCVASLAVIRLALFASELLRAPVAICDLFRRLPPRRLATG